MFCTSLFVSCPLYLMSFFDLRLLLTPLLRVNVMVFNATFNNISLISWRSVFLVMKTGVPGENHRPVASHGQTLSYIACAGFELTALVVIGTDCIGSYKSNYHMITATTPPRLWYPHIFLNEAA